MTLWNGHMCPCLKSNALGVAFIPSWCEMFVYSNLTSIVAMIVLGGKVSQCQK